MLRLLGLLLLIWVACMFVGALVHTLIWLLIIGVVLFIATSLFGWIKRESLGARHR